MGDPKQQQKQYATPLRPWDKERIDLEAKLIRSYGLESKKELWRTETTLRRFRRQARNLMAATGEQAEKESKQLLEKLKNLGLVDDDDNIVDVLRLDIEDVLARRLQSVVFTKGLARSTNEARQMVNHGHIAIGGKRVTEPGYLVSVEEEEELDHHPNSSYKDAIEPEKVRSSRPAELNLGGE